MAAFPKFLLDTTIPQYLAPLCARANAGPGGGKKAVCWGRQVGLEKGGWGRPWKLCDWGPLAVGACIWGRFSQPLGDRQGAGPDELLEQSGVAARRETSMGGRLYLRFGA